MSKDNRQFTIDWEAADRITLLSLQESRDSLKKDLKKHIKDPAKHWMHPDDVAENPILVKHFDEIIKYYGGE